VRFEDEFTVDRPADEVFEQLADAERMPEWTEEFERVEKITNGAVGVGTSYLCQPVRPQRGEWTFEWAEYEPGRRLRFEGDTSGPVQRTGSYTLSANGSGQTTVRVVIEPRLGWVMKLFSPLVWTLLRKHAARDVRALKRWLGSASVVVSVALGDLADSLGGLSQCAALLVGSP
jgi:uncharacterized protein YndB with AHSA1/START domain